MNTDNGIKLRMVSIDTVNNEVAAESNTSYEEATTKRTFKNGDEEISWV